MQWTGFLHICFQSCIFVFKDGIVVIQMKVMLASEVLDDHIQQLWERVEFWLLNMFNTSYLNWELALLIIFLKPWVFQAFFLLLVLCNNMGCFWHWGVKWYIFVEMICNQFQHLVTVCNNKEANHDCKIFNSTTIWAWEMWSLVRRKDMIFW